jgi:tetratricopeptide (TPR) repeat protein
LRAALEARWHPARDGARSVASAVEAVCDVLAASAREWENADAQAIGAPATGRAAARSIASDADELSASAHARFEKGEVQEAIGDLTQAIATQIDKQLLVDLADALHRTGQSSEARAVLRTALAIDPANADARRRLADLEGLPPAPVRGEPVDVTAQWLSPTQRPRANARFMMERL